jgi:hypothetical protein
MIVVRFEFQPMGYFTIRGKVNFQRDAEEKPNAGVGVKG